MVGGIHLYLPSCRASVRLDLTRSYPIVTATCTEELPPQQQESCLRQEQNSLHLTTSTELEPMHGASEINSDLGPIKIPTA